MNLCAEHNMDLQQPLKQFTIISMFKSITLEEQRLNMDATNWESYLVCLLLFLNKEPYGGRGRAFNVKMSHESPERNLMNK